jgi:peptide/nickel transport system substrate-binding protein
VRGPGAALAVAALTALALAVADCGSASVSGRARHHRAPRIAAITGTLPAGGRPLRGGAITAGQLAGQTPAQILPLAGGAGCTTPTLDFIAEQYLPLYTGPAGVTPALDEALSAARPPVYSDGDRTVTITLKPGLRWSDGAPVDASDLIFDIDLLRAAVSAEPANWCQFQAGQFPGDVASVSARGRRSVVLSLTHPVNPSWFTADQLEDTGAGLYPLPSTVWNVASTGGAHIGNWASDPAAALAIFKFLRAQGTDPATFGSSPLWKVVDGPFRLASFNASSGAYTLVANPRYGLRPRPRLAAVSVRTYGDPQAMLAALRAGQVEVGSLDPSTQLPAIPGLERRGLDVFGGPGWGWYGGVINFKDTTDDFSKVVAQPYIRGVLAELVDQPQIIKRVYHGWAVPEHGPVPVVPRSPYLSAAATRVPWPYDPARAAATLRAHGWRVRPGGRTTCAHPGQGVRECGPGIPAGTPISFTWANLPASVSPIGLRESRIFAVDARRYAGIDVRFLTASFGVLTADYNDQGSAATANRNAWAVNNFGGALTGYYPTQAGLLGPGGALNLGGYGGRRVRALLQASISSPGRGAISREVSYLSRLFPVLYMPDQDWITVVADRVGGPPAAFAAMTQRQYFFQLLYRVRRR